jgi:fatty-acyl-CoA synthase
MSTRLEPRPADEFSDTLNDAIERAALETHHGLIFPGQPDGDRKRTWSELVSAARRVAAGLQNAGAAPRDVICVVAFDPEELVIGLLGVLTCGALPVALAPRSPLGSDAAHGERLLHVVTGLGARQLVVGTRAVQRGIEGGPNWPRAVPVLAIRELAECDKLGVSAADPSPDSAALLQLTSGSTREPVAIAVSHRNLVENVRATHALLGSRGQCEIGVSWLPLWHDMGLISALITPLLARNTQVVMAPHTFATSPRSWLEAIHRYEATISVTTNFGLHLAMKRAPRTPGFHLRALKTLIVGAEPINPAVLSAFIDRFAPHGLAAAAVRPAYGMAEATLAVTAAPSAEGPRELRLDRARYEHERTAVAAAAGRTLDIVSCGVPLPGHAIAILDDAGAHVPDGTVGEIAVRGPSLSLGRYTKGDIESHALADGWLRSGDLGFVNDGELYVSGRKKDLIIVAGRNIHPQLVEWHVGRQSGVRENAVAAFAVPGHDTERLVVVLEPVRLVASDELAARVRSCVARELGVGASDVVIVHPWCLPKTTSGKIQRAQARRLYLDGALLRIASERSDLHA